MRRTSVSKYMSLINFKTKKLNSFFFLILNGVRISSLLSFVAGIFNNFLLNEIYYGFKTHPEVCEEENCECTDI